MSLYCCFWEEAHLWFEFKKGWAWAWALCAAVARTPPPHPHLLKRRRKVGEAGILISRWEEPKPSSLGFGLEQGWRIKEMLSWGLKNFPRKDKAQQHLSSQHFLAQSEARKQKLWNTSWEMFLQCSLKVPGLGEAGAPRETCLMRFPVWGRWSCCVQNKFVTHRLGLGFLLPLAKSRSSVGQSLHLWNGTVGTAKHQRAVCGLKPTFIESN